MNANTPKGFVWVCVACGKRSNDLYGNCTIDFGWDESCMLNSVLAKKSDLKIENSRVSQINGPTYKNPEDIALEKMVQENQEMGLYDNDATERKSGEAE